MNFISFDSHLSTDIESTSSIANMALPVSISAIGLGTGNLFHIECRIREDQIHLVGQPGERGPNDKGPLHAAGFTMEDILMPQKPTIPEGLEAFFLWTEQQSAGRIMVSQGNLDAAIIEKNTLENKLPWPKRFHSVSDLRSWSTMYAILNDKEMPLTPQGTSSMSLETTLNMLDIVDNRGESHISAIDAAYTAQIASLLLRNRNFFYDLDETIDVITHIVEEYRQNLKKSVISGANAFISIDLPYLK